MQGFRKRAIRTIKGQEELQMDYKNSGVDIEAGYRAVELMWRGRCAPKC